MKWVIPSSRQMQRLVRPFQAEAHVEAIYPGSLKEPVMIEPLQRSVLNASPALGNDPNLTAKGVHERRHHVEHAFVGRSAQGILERAADEGCIRRRILSGANQNTANINSKSHCSSPNLLIMCSIPHPAAISENLHLLRLYSIFG